MNELLDIINVGSDPVMDDDNLCASCTKSLCCRYITLSIETPRSMRDFDNLLWKVSHRGIRIYRDSEGWGVQSMNSCDHLLPGGGCGIYETRPMVCREHSNEDCEFRQAEDDSVLEFSSHKELDDYCRQKFKSWDRRFKQEGLE